MNEQGSLPPALQRMLRQVNVHDHDASTAMEKLRERAMTNMNSYLRAVNLRLATAQTGDCIPPRGEARL